MSGIKRDFLSKLMNGYHTLMKTRSALSSSYNMLYGEEQRGFSVPVPTERTI